MVNNLSAQTATDWITGPEFSNERRRLIREGKTNSPEMEHLRDRARKRDDFLWKKYAEPLIEQHRGRFAAVSVEGIIILGGSLSEVGAKATKRFGESNFVAGRLDDFRGIDLRRW